MTWILKIKEKINFMFQLFFMFLVCLECIWPRKWIYRESYNNRWLARDHARLVLPQCLKTSNNVIWQSENENEGKINRPFFTKSDVRHYHVIVLQRRQRNVHVQSCWFADLNLLLKVPITKTRGNHWLRIRVRHLQKNYGNEIESKGVQFLGRSAPDKINRGG